MVLPIECPHCHGVFWPDGEDRDAMVVLGAAVARHLRDDHDDETAALSVERTMVHAPLR